MRGVAHPVVRTPRRRITPEMYMSGSAFPGIIPKIDGYCDGEESAPRFIRR